MARTISELLCEAGKHVSHGSNVIVSGIAENNKDLRTVTIDWSKNLFLGLHIDSWDRLPATLRGNASNRVCMNIGDCDRYLLFVPYKLSEMIKECPSYNANDVIYRFMSKHPDLQVLRIKVCPGEAYVAPTETIIHDGNTEGSWTTSVSCTFRGFFSFTKECSEIGQQATSVVENAKKVNSTMYRN